MADQKDRQIQEAKELQQALTEIGQRKEALERETKAMQEEQAQVAAKMQELQAKHVEIGQTMIDKTTKLNEIKQGMYQRESEYMALLEAQPSLVQVMRSY